MGRNVNLKRSLILLLFIPIFAYGDYVYDHIKPNTDNTFDLGTLALNWRDIYTESVRFDITASPATEPEGLVWWNGTDHGLNVSSGLGPVGQIPFENWLIVRNESGLQIDDGSIVFISGALSGRPTIELAKADKPTTVNRTMGVATMNIPNSSEGIVTTFGLVREIDTTGCVAGDQLYVSATSAGAFTNVQPVYPNYIIKIGNCLTVGASGDISVNVVGRIEDILENAWNGGFLETINFTIDSNGTVITGTLENADNTEDLTMNFSTGFEILDVTPGATVTLTVGTDDNPQKGFVYIPISTKILTASTSDWPVEQHIKVANIALRTAASTQTDGALGNRNWNDHIAASSNSMGHAQEMAVKLRKFEAQWDSGAEGSLTIVGANTPDDLFVAATSGVIYQLHPQTFPALDMATGDDIHVVNDSVAPYKTITNLNSELTDASGVSLSNKYYSLVVWGVINKSGQTSHLMVNLPISSYNSSSGAQTDPSNFSVYDIPSIFQGLGFLISRFTLKHSPAGGGTWTLEATQDLRGFLPNTTAGGGAGGGGVSTFLGLTDTESAYTGDALKIPRVNAGETALEFVTLSHTGLTELAWTLSDHTGNANTLPVFDGTGAAQEIGLGNALEIPQVDATGNFIEFTDSPTVLTLKIKDPNSSNTLAIRQTSPLSVNRIITLLPGDKSFTIAIASGLAEGGQIALGDWFNQAVMTTSSPAFANVDVTSKISIGDFVQFTASELAFEELDGDSESFTISATNNNVNADIILNPDVKVDVQGALTVANLITATGGLTTPGTVTAEQLTSTHDISMAGVLTNVVPAATEIGVNIDGDTSPHVISTGDVCYYSTTRTSEDSGSDLTTWPDSITMNKNLFTIAAGFVGNSTELANTKAIGNQNNVIRSPGNMLVNAWLGPPSGRTIKLIGNEMSFTAGGTYGISSGILTTHNMIFDFIGANALVDGAALFQETSGVTTVNAIGGDFKAQLNYGSSGADTYEINHYGGRFTAVGKSTGTSVSYGGYFSGTGSDQNYDIFAANASSDNIIAGSMAVGSTTIPTEALQVTGNTETSGNFISGGNTGLSATYSFGGGGTGDIATMTFTGGILTAVTTIP